MIKVKMRWRLLLSSFVALVCIFLAQNVQAQNTLGNLFKQVLNSEPIQAAPQPMANESLPSGLLPSAAPSRAAEPVLWATKAEFLAAARNGELIAIDGVVHTHEFDPVVVSIATILKTDYGVAFPFKDFRENSRNSDIQACQRSFEGNVGSALSNVTILHAKTLSDTSPDFYKDPSKDAIRNVDYVVRDLNTSGGYCDLKILGVKKPHPFKAALLKLMDEYGQATKEYVETERGRRKIAYADEQAQKQAQQKAIADAQAKRAADARAVEQQRIDEERARIQNVQKKREKQEQNRVGG
jgi:hypothetical protein